MPLSIYGLDAFINKRKKKAMFAFDMEKIYDKLIQCKIKILNEIIAIILEEKIYEIKK